MRIACGLALLTAAGCASVDARTDVNPRFSPPNLPMPTLGGMQFWGDVHWQEGWRIQRHAETGHFRLLDARHVRRAWGSYAACLLSLRELAPPPHEGPRALVVLLHGMGRSPHSLAGLRKGLIAEGWTVATLNYPSLRHSLEDHAAQLDLWLDRLQGVDQVHFVSHSLGGIVLRAALGGEDGHGMHVPPFDAPNRDRPWRGRIRVGSAVMIGPPSHGSALADRLHRHRAYKWIYGDTGDVLRSGHLGHVPLPQFRFGIVAGARGDESGWNPLIPGDNDGVVGVAETMLEGADGHMVVTGPRAVHTILMNHPDVVSAVHRFFRGGPLKP